MEITIENLTTLCNINKEYREEVIKIIDKIDKELLSNAVSNGYIHSRLIIKLDSYLFDISDYIIKHYKRKGFKANYSCSQEEDGVIEFEVTD